MILKMAILLKNPVWTGDQNLFKVNSSFQLQLSDTAENQAFLGTANTMIVNTEWRCWIKLSFSPSSNNYARYYLISDNENLSESLNGYFYNLENRVAMMQLNYSGKMEMN